MAITFKDLRDNQIITKKNFDEMIEEIRRILEESNEVEFDDVPF